MKNPEEYYSDLVENATDCFYLLDATGHIRFLNRAVTQLTGYTLQELQGKHFSFFFSDNEYKKIIRKFENGNPKNRNRVLQTWLSAKSNTIISVELTMIPIFRQKRVVGFHGIVRDITKDVIAEQERKKRSQEIQRINRQLIDKNKQLSEMNQLKTQFLSTISHELRTPLNCILGYAELLREELYGQVNEAQVNALKNIFDSGNHLLKLINELLDFSRIHKGKFQLYPEANPIVNIIEAAVSTIKPSLNGEKLKFIQTLEDDLPILYIDAQKIYQVLLNLLSNAVKFTDSGEIELKVYCNKGFLEFAIRDTGIGIAEPDIKKIFEDFQQVDGSISRKYGGAGLGLSLAKNLIHLHGGEIWVDSTLRKGSTFYFNLPIDHRIDSNGDKPSIHSSEDQVNMEWIL